MIITDKDKKAIKFCENLKGFSVRILNSEEDWIIKKWNTFNHDILISRDEVEKKITRDQITEIKTNKHIVIEAATKALKKGRLQIDKGGIIKVIFFSGLEEQQIYLNDVGEFMNEIYFPYPAFRVEVYKYENERFIFCR